MNRNWNPWSLATIALLAITGLVICTTAHQYGDSWDEQVRYKGGEEKLTYYTHLLQGDFEEAKGDNYPGFHDLNLALLRRVSPFFDFVTGNLFSAFLGFLGILGAIYLGRLLGGPQTGFWSGLILTTVPAWYGHMFINPKDIPFAFAYIWSLASIFNWIKHDKPSWGVVIATGLAIGVTMACRVGGLVLFCYLGLFLLIGFLLGLRKRESALQSHCLRWVKIHLPRLLVACIIAGGLMLLYWPAAHSGLLSRASQTLETVTRYQWQMPVFFDGTFAAAEELPRTYILTMLFLKLPLVTLALFLGGSLIVLQDGIGGIFKNEETESKSLGLLLILFGFLFPISYVILKDSILYNGLRHLLFVIPPACVIAGLAASKGLGWVKQTYPQLVPVSGFVLGLTFLGLGFQLVRLHPYQYISYNALAGGTAKASERYELDYWGTVYKEMAEAFYAYLKTEKPSFTKPEVIVNMEHVTYLFSPFLPEETTLPIHVVRSQPMIDDYYAASTTWSADQFYYGETVVEVQRAGVTLGVIKDRRYLKPEERELGYSPQK